MMAPADIPVITTDRLILRGPDARDIVPFVAHFLSDRSRFTGGPLPQHRAWIAFAAELGHWALHGFGMWTVTWKEDADHPIGLVGCWYPEPWPERELGWLVWPEAEGQSVAFEATQAARGTAYDRFGWTTAVSYIDPGNARSIRLAERLGAVRDDAAERPSPEDLVYRHPAPEAL